MSPEVAELFHQLVDLSPEARAQYFADHPVDAKTRLLHRLLTGKPPRETRPSQLATELKGDLELVLQTALRPEPQERYASVEEFAGDLEACLDSRPNRARRGDRVYRARKFVRRYWLATALTGAVAAALVSAGLAWYWLRPGSALKNLRPERVASQNRMIVTIHEALGVMSYNTNLWELQLNAVGALVSGGLRKLTAWTDFPIRSGSLTTDGKRLGQDNGSVISELDLVKGKGREIYREGDSHSGTPDISPAGNLLATASGTKIILRSFLTGAVVREIPVRGVTNLISLDYAPDAKGFFAGDVTATEARQLYIDLSGKTPVLWRQTGSPSIWGVPSPDVKRLAMMMFTNDSNVYMVENF